MRTTRTIQAGVALTAVVLLTSCGGSKFSEWANNAAKTKVDSSNVTSQVNNGNALLAVICTTWPTASADERSKAPANLADSATKAGFPSTADDALAWLDGNCKS